MQGPRRRFSHRLFLPACTGSTVPWPTSTDSNVRGDSTHAGNFAMSWDRPAWTGTAGVARAVAGISNASSRFAHSVVSVALRVVKSFPSPYLPYHPRHAHVRSSNVACPRKSGPFSSARALVLLYLPNVGMPKQLRTRCMSLLSLHEASLPVRNQGALWSGSWSESLQGYSLWNVEMLREFFLGCRSHPRSFIYYSLPRYHVCKGELLK